jgi:hypothetical protein
VLAFCAINPLGGALVMLAGSCLALVYNLFLFHLIQVLKGVTTNILGNVKVVLIIMMSHYLFGDILDWYRVFGALITFLGAGLYTAGNYRLGTPEGMAEQAALRRHYTSVMTAILMGTLIAAMCFVYFPSAAAAAGGLGGDSMTPVDHTMAAGGDGVVYGVGLDGVVGLDVGLMNTALEGGEAAAAGGDVGSVGFEAGGGGGFGEEDLFDEEPREDVVVNHPGFVQARPVEETDLFSEDR